MSEDTKIEWCDSTFNAWIGCDKVSPACDDCYAARSTPARTLGIVWGPKESRYRTADATWTDPLRWNAKHSEFFAKHGRRRRVFSLSLGDWLDNKVPIEWFVAFLELVRRTENLDWLLLSKRIGNCKSRLQQAQDYVHEHWPAVDAQPLSMWITDWLEGGNPPANVWMGATVVNQEEADRDIPKLLAVPARVRFLSIEPMLGPISLRWLPAFIENAPYIGQKPGGPGTTTDHLDGLRRLNWVICGGESGPKARPMHPDWARSLRDQCAAAGVPFLFKQWGEWSPINEQDEAFTNRLYRSNRKAEPHENQEALDDCYGRTCTVPYGVVHHDGSFHEPLEPMAFLVGTGAMTTFKVGKAAAGRRLAGVEHDGFPPGAQS